MALGILVSATSLCFGHASLESHYQIGVLRHGSLNLISISLHHLRGTAAYKEHHISTIPSTTNIPSTNIFPKSHIILLNSNPFSIIHALHPLAVVPLMVPKHQGPVKSIPLTVSYHSQINSQTQSSLAELQAYLGVEDYEYVLTMNLVCYEPLINLITVD